MGDVGSHEDDRFPEQFRSMFRHQDGDNTFQLGVDLETDVGQHMGSCPDHILALVVLRGHADQAVPHQLHFLIHRLGNGGVMDIFAEADLLH